MGTAQSKQTFMCLQDASNKCVSQPALPFNLIFTHACSLNHVTSEQVRPLRAPWTEHALERNHPQHVLTVGRGGVWQNIPPAFCLAAQCGFEGARVCDRLPGQSWVEPFGEAPRRLQPSDARVDAAVQVCQDGPSQRFVQVCKCVLLALSMHGATMRAKKLLHQTR